MPKSPFCHSFECLSLLHQRNSSSFILSLHKQYFDHACLRTSCPALVCYLWCRLYSRFSRLSPMRRCQYVHSHGDRNPSCQLHYGDRDSSCQLCYGYGVSSYQLRYRNGEPSCQLPHCDGNSSWSRDYIQFEHRKRNCIIYRIHRSLSNFQS